MAAVCIMGVMLGVRARFAALRRQMRMLAGVPVVLILHKGAERPEGERGILHPL